MFSTKKHQSTAIKTKSNRRHSLRLTSVSKPRPIIRETRKNHSSLLHTNHSSSPLAPKWRKVENESSEENSTNNDEGNDDDDYDELLARHHRLMLEEQKDRK